MLYYLIYGDRDPIFAIENAIQALTPWLCLGALLLVDRIWTGAFNPKRSYFLTTLLVTFVFLAMPWHCLCIGLRAMLECAFKFSAIVSLFFLSLNYALERIKDKLEIDDW